MNRRNFLKKASITGAGLLVPQNVESETPKDESLEKALEAARQDVINAHTSYLLATTDTDTPKSKKDFEAEMNEFQSEIEQIDDLVMLIRLRNNYAKLQLNQRSRNIRRQKHKY